MLCKINAWRNYLQAATGLISEHSVLLNLTFIGIYFLLSTVCVCRREFLLTTMGTDQEDFVGTRRFNFALEGMDL